MGLRLGCDFTVEKPIQKKAGIQQLICTQGAAQPRTTLHAMELHWLQLNTDGICLVAFNNSPPKENNSFNVP